MSIITNAEQLARRLQAKARQIEAAVARGLRKIGATVEREQIKRLSGSKGAAPGTYPVPARTGHLRRETFFDVKTERLVVVGNSATYAAAIHEGDAPSTSVHGPRRFLNDAVLAVDGTELMAAEVRKALEAA